MANPGQTAVQGMNEQQILAINYLIDLKMARLSEGQVEHTLETLRMGEAELTRNLAQRDGREVRPDGHEVHRDAGSS